MRIRLLAALAVVLLAACSVGDDDSGAVETAVSASTAPAPAPISTVAETEPTTPPTAAVISVDTHLSALACADEVDQGSLRAMIGEPVEYPLCEDAEIRLRAEGFDDLADSVRDIVNEAASAAGADSGYGGEVDAWIGRFQRDLDRLAAASD